MEDAQPSEEISSSSLDQCAQLSLEEITEAEMIVKPDGKKMVSQLKDFNRLPMCISD